MAYAALASLTQTIDLILNHHHQYSLSLDKKQQIISIDKYAILFQAFLDEFPQKVNGSLEARIKDVANAAEDLIEYSIRKQKAYGFRLKKVADRFDLIASEVMDIKNSFRIKDLQLLLDPPPTSSRLALAAGKNDMVGFEDDLLAIKGRLCGGSSKLGFIPIVGMGGMGKTTLARNVYDDPLSLQHFDIRAWVTVSQDYSWHDIFLSLLVSMKVLNPEKTGQSDELMAANVHKNLKGRRYLVVMDDVWSVNACDDLGMVFPDDGNGSRIILTTRLSNVAAYPDPGSPLHEMRFMDPDQSWKLLRQRVFVEEAECPHELENIGKEIAKSCGGLPLAIVVIAGVLSTVSKTAASWEEIAANVNSAVALEGGQFEKILSLSYSHLPYHLRSCFLYMGGFPEDYEIRVSKLIKLWIAEGFLKHGSKGIEEGAEEHVEDLVRRSLVLVTKRKPNGKIKSCRVHDLVRDLCIRTAKQESFLVNLMNESTSPSSSSLCNLIFPKKIKDQRRLSIVRSHLNSTLANFHSLTIRTIKCFHCAVSSLGPLVNFRLLRVLDMTNSAVSSLQSFGSEEFNKLPGQVFELIHLRYLAFDYPVYIPAAILNLENLQALIIRAGNMWLTFLPEYIGWGSGLSHFLYLPLEILRMPQLRHLTCFSIDLSTYLEEANFDILENLQTLSVATNFLRNEQFETLIPNLKKLSITHYEDRHVHGMYFDNLVHLHKLESLKFHVRAGTLLRRWHIPDLPPLLKKLTLIGCRLPTRGIIGSLPNLEVLKLRELAFDGGKWETDEEEFRELKFLLIEKSNLQHWTTDSSHFPLLKCLLLHRCRYLGEIPQGIGEIPTLELIEVENGNTSLVESAKRIQGEQQDWGNDVLQVRCVRY